jgi:hypothetical protein
MNRELARNRRRRANRRARMKAVARLDAGERLAALEWGWPEWAARHMAKGYNLKWNVGAARATELSTVNRELKRNRKRRANKRARIKAVARLEWWRRQRERVWGPFGWELKDEPEPLSFALSGHS